MDTNRTEAYFELCYTKRIHEFAKIDSNENWPEGTAKAKYKSLDNYYSEKLQISIEELIQLRSNFKKFNDLYTRYFNENRQELFKNSEAFIEWYDKQNESCFYCEVSQIDLHRIVDSRNGNLTLNQKTKRSKGTLEIEQRDPNLQNGYTFENSVLACPFCNNAKSNLISEEDWVRFFAPAMKKYIKSILENDPK